MGLNEVKALETELAEAAEKLGYKNMEQKDFLEKIRNEKSQQVFISPTFTSSFFCMKVFLCSFSDLTVCLGVFDSSRLY